jgi:PIN domain nuclease of toxin-antitoxin system
VIVAVADTHVVVWYLFNNPKLSAVAKEAVESAFREGHQIGVSSISLVELVYLVEKGRIPETAFDLLIQNLEDPGYPFQEVAVDGAIAAQMQQVSREEIPDMPDRIVAATGLYHRVPIISRDGKIRAANLRTIW